MEQPAQEFFRRLNLAPGATAAIVAMRLDLSGRLRQDRRAGARRCRPDASARLLVQSRLPRAAPHRLATPAAILEKIIPYEAVHEIQGWDDLRRRLDPPTGAASPSSTRRWSTSR